jgi:hypothetical protein
MGRITDEVAGRTSVQTTRTLHVEKHVSLTRDEVIAVLLEALDMPADSEVKAQGLSTITIHSEYETTEHDPV